MQTLELPPKTLAIDYGLKRTGCAISYAWLCEPAGVIFADAHTEVGTTKLLDALVAVIAEHGVVQIVVGLSEGEMAKRTRAFVALLQERTTAKVFFVDETLSSQEARELMRHLPRAKRSGADDQYAAALLLERWFEVYYANEHDHE